MKKLLSFAALAATATAAHADHLYGVAVHSYSQTASVSGMAAITGTVKTTSSMVYANENCAASETNAHTTVGQTGSASLSYSISLDVWWYDGPPSSLYLQHFDASAVSATGSITGYGPYGAPSTVSGNCSTGDVSYSFTNTGGPPPLNYPYSASSTKTKTTKYSTAYTGLTWDVAQDFGNGHKLYKLHNPLSFTTKTASASGSAWCYGYYPTNPAWSRVVLSQGVAIANQTFRVSATP